MIAEFERFNLDIPAAIAIAIARLDHEHYPAVVDRVLRDYPDLRLHVCRISRIRQCLHLCASQAVLRHHSYRIIKLFYFTSDVHKLGDCRIQMFRNDI